MIIKSFVFRGRMIGERTFIILLFVVRLIVFDYNPVFDSLQGREGLVCCLNHWFLYAFRSYVILPHLLRRKSYLDSKYRKKNYLG